MSDITITITREVSETLKQELVKAARKIAIGIITTVSIKVISDNIIDRWQMLKEKKKAEETPVEE